jgi:hypothetical protein
VAFCRKNESIGERRNNNVCSTAGKMFFVVILWLASYHIRAIIGGSGIVVSVATTAILRTTLCTQARGNQNSTDDKYCCLNNRLAPARIS